MTYFFRLVRAFIILTLLFGIVIVAGVLYYMEYELPDIEALNTVQLQVPLQIYTHDKKLIATFGEKHRIPIPYDQVPEKLIQAVLATEDQRYFQHAGVDIPGLGRAALQLLLTGRKVQGGSTITMQVARSFYLTRHKTFARKLREILLAIKIDHRLKKDKILELYLNKVFLGNRAYGVAAAAEVYYGKRLNELTLDQYAMLAGLPKAPSTLNPLANPQAAIKRRDHVLWRMRDQNYITQKEYEEAVKAPLNAAYHDLQTEIKAPFAAELVREQLEQMYGDIIYTNGSKVYTTLDSQLQVAANLAVRNNVLAYDQRHGYRGPLENLGTPSLATMQEWEQILAKKPDINGLEPAAVVEMTAQTITVLRKNGSLTIIPWTGLSWARKQINPDYLGPKPRTANQIVRLGDVVLINPVAQGYQLAQVPKAEGSLVALNPQNGSILALTGGFNFQTSKFNRITSAQRQPGSSFKPFIYSAALEKGFTLATVIHDAPIIIENTADNSLWRPQNDTHKFYGPTRLRTAITQSRNLVSIRLLALVGMSYTVDYLKRFGFTPAQLPPGLSLALGTATVTPLQMAQSYAVFANGGLRVIPFLIDNIQDSQNEVIYQAKPLVACDNECKPGEVAAPRVLSPENTFLITSALHDVIQRGTAKLAKNIGRNDLAGKTGTTQNQVDAWFAGYNPNIVAVTWMGFDQPQSLHEYGSGAALPMWIEFIQMALKNKPPAILPQPSGILSIRIDPMTGRRTTADDRDGINEFFMEPYLPETGDEDADLADNRPDTDTPELNNNPSTDDDNRPQQTNDDADNTIDYPQPDSPDAMAPKASTPGATPQVMAANQPSAQSTATINNPSVEKLLNAENNLMHHLEKDLGTMSDIETPPKN